MARYFATVPQSSKEGVTERMSSRRRNHDSSHSNSRLPQWGNRPKGDNDGPPVNVKYRAMLAVGPCRESQGRVRRGSPSLKASNPAIRAFAMRSLAGCNGYAFRVARAPRCSRTAFRKRSMSEVRSKTRTSGEARAISRGRSFRSRWGQRLRRCNADGGAPTRSQNALSSATSLLVEST